MKYIALYISLATALLVSLAITGITVTLFNVRPVKIVEKELIVNRCPDNDPEKMCIDKGGVPILSGWDGRLTRCDSVLN